MNPLISLCSQRSPALPGRAEEATAESDEEDQHLHWHFHALLRSLRDHKVSAGGAEGGGGLEVGSPADTMRQAFFFFGIVFMVSPKTCLLGCHPPLYPLLPPLCLLITSAGVGRLGDWLTL